MFVQTGPPLISWCFHWTMIFNCNIGYSVLILNTQTTSIYNTVHTYSNEKKRSAIFLVKRSRFFIYVEIASVRCLARPRRSVE